MKPLPHCQWETAINYDARHRVVSGVVNNFGLQILSLLIEMGPDSNHAYQLDLNHRNLDPMFYYSTRVGRQSGQDQNPMIKSLFSPAATEHFTAISPVSAFIHGISVSDANVGMLRTSMKVDLPRSGGVVEFGHSHIRNVKGEYISGRGRLNACFPFSGLSG